MKIGLRKWILSGLKEFFLMTFDFKNGCKNEFQENNEKSCSWSRNRVSHKINFKAVWPRNGHAADVGVMLWRFFIFLNFGFEWKSILAVSSNFAKSIANRRSHSQIARRQVFCSSTKINLVKHLLFTILNHCSTLTHC